METNKKNPGRESFSRNEQFSRTVRLIGDDAMTTLERSRVAVFGLGGVGGYVCEALVRSGVGAIDLIDHDTVDLSNLNRQIIATQDTIGRQKTDVMKERLLSINPELCVRIHPCFFLPETADQFRFEEYDYVVDAVDTVTAKIEIILQAQRAGVPVISCMGTGNKLDPTRLKVADIYKTQVCPLAKVMRRELKKRGVKRLKVVYSEELPITPVTPDRDSGGEQMPAGKRAVPGSTAFVPPVAGMILASEVIRDLTGVDEKR